MENENDCCEPLNLTMKKKKPIAVVAPSSIIDNNKNINKYDNNETVNNKNFDSPPEDLSYNKCDNILNNNNECLDLTNKYNKNEINSLNLKENNTGLFQNEQIKNFIEKDTINDFNNSFYDKNIFTNENITKFYDDYQKSNNIFKDAYKITENFYDNNNKQISTTPENIYSMINTLAEQKFLTALYMNQLLTQNFGYNFMYPSANGNVLEQNILNNQNNLLLNNFADKQKSLPSQLFKVGDKNLNIESIIKNEVNNPTNNAKTTTSQPNKRYFTTNNLTFNLNRAPF